MDMSLKKNTTKGTSANKKVKNATSLVYNDIKFRSKLEVFCYKQLILNNIQSDYEKYKFTLIDSFKYKDEAVRKMTYTPDFVGNKFIIECKGFANDAFPLRWKMFKKFLFDNNLDYDLYLPRNQKQVKEVIETIIEKNAE